MTSLVKYDAMCRAIDVAYDFDEVKEIRDKLAMLEAAARVAGNVKAEERCWQIRKRAEKKANKLYDASKKAKRGADGDGKGNQRSANPTSATLAELGVTKQEMAEWRKLNSVSDEQFEAALAKGKPSIAEVTGKKKPERSAASAAALWVWGRVLDFERNGTLALKPSEVRNEMAEHQIEDVKRLVPKIVKWLTQVQGKG